MPGDPGGLNPNYFTEYPEAIRMYGGTFETKVRWRTAFGELTYRPNQPLQYNAFDLMRRLHLAPTPLRGKMRDSGRASFSGYERHKNVQLQLGAVGQIPACSVRRASTGAVRWSTRAYRTCRTRAWRASAGPTSSGRAR